MRIDAHQHFWQYSTAEFGWIDDSMASIRRDFLPSDLRPLLDASAIDATVAVQACQSIEETAWLLSLAQENNWIQGVVGWVPLIDPAVESTLDQLAANSKLKGVRHVLQAEPDAYLAREDFNAGIALLQSRGLVYDVLVVERQLPAAIEFIDRHPNQQFILDHVAKPLVATHTLDPWQSQIRELALRPNVACKLSGMVTEADFEHWTLRDLQPYVDTVLEAFGPDHLLFGSDWPVCTVASSYSHWVQTVHKLLAPLSHDEQAKIFGDNAVKFYKLDNVSSY